jgi:hypothetical protein
VDSDTAFRLTNENGGPNPGSITLMDTLLQNVQTGVLVTPLNNNPGNDTPGITLENLGLRFVDRTVADTAGATLLPNPTGTGSLIHWTVGPTYKNGERTWFSGNASTYTRESTLLGGGGQAGPPLDKYRGTTYPDYETASPDSFVHIKDYGAKGEIVQKRTRLVADHVQVTVPPTTLKLSKALLTRLQTARNISMSMPVYTWSLTRSTSPKNLESSEKP